MARGDVAPLGAPDGELTAGDLALLMRAVRGDDVDGDGLATRQELGVGTSPFAADTDGNGTPDGAEDADGDGLSNAAEFAAGADPWAEDTDGDGLADGADPEPAAGVVYRHGDQLGSTVLLTGAGGALLQRAVYRPYGEAVPDTAGGPAETPEFGFTGQRHVASVGLYDYGARFYDPALGRFLQADPVVPDPFDPQSLNRYAYVRNSPINATDPTGNSTQPLPGGGWGFGFGCGPFGLCGGGGGIGSTPVFNPSGGAGHTPVFNPSAGGGLPGSLGTLGLSRSLGGPGLSPFAAEVRGPSGGRFSGRSRRSGKRSPACGGG